MVGATFYSAGTSGAMGATVSGDATRRASATCERGAP